MLLSKLTPGAVNQSFAEAFVSHDRHTLFALEESEPPRTIDTYESQ
jgi:hypothetical protein